MATSTFTARFGRLWAVLSGERGEYELASGRSAGAYLQSMADATNDGYFVPEQIWDRSDISCFALGRPTGSASPLNWPRDNTCALPSRLTLATTSTRRPW